VSNSAPRFAHQVDGTERLLTEPAYILGWEPGLGKSRAVTDAACALYDEGVIDTVIVVCPARLRSIWADPDPVLGEWAKWAWPHIPTTILEYHAKTTLPAGKSTLTVAVTNPEFLRRPERLDPLIAWAKGRRVLLVLDESWLYASHKAQQTKAVWKLRLSCARVVLLNGTLGQIKEQYAQFAMLSPRVFEMNWWQWRARFCRMGGWQSKQIVGYQNEDEYARRTAPYVMIRETRECLDLGEAPIRTTIDARLTPETWKVYVDLRDEFLAYLGDGTATALQAGVRAMRLAQVVNGFVGGVEWAEVDLLDPLDTRSTMRSTVQELGREKLDALIGYLTDAGCPSKVLIFTRFRPDVERTVRVLAETFPNHRVLPFYGQQAEAEQNEAKRLLAPDGPTDPGIVVANVQSGGAGLNLTAAALLLFLANTYSRKDRKQGEGRVYRAGQTKRVTIGDVVASGPQGQPTVDRSIVAALRRNEDLAQWSIEAWRRCLMGEG